MVGVCFLRNHVLCDSACSFCTPDSTFRPYSKELTNCKGIFWTPVTLILIVYTWCKPFLIQENPKFSYFLFAPTLNPLLKYFTKHAAYHSKLIWIHFKNHNRFNQTQKFIYLALTQQHVFGKNGRLYTIFNEMEMWSS